MKFGCDCHPFYKRFLVHLHELSLQQWRRLTIALAVSITTFLACQIAPGWSIRAASAADTTDGARLDWLEKEWRKLSSAIAESDPARLKKNRYSCRETMDYALECAAVYPDRAEVMIEQTRRMQDLDPNSKTFGNFAWYA